MPQPSHPDAPLATAGDAGATGERRQSPERVERQDTLLLSDVPEASALMPEASASVQSPPSNATQPAGAQAAAPHFPTLDLSPLSQRYELLAEAGHGSMGNVYKARDRETGETVALKLLKPEIASDQTMMERFKKELLFARKITHKNVCRVHDFNRIGGIAYTSMEFVEGESLRSVLNRFGGLPQRKALDLAQQMCSALQEAHAQGIVHRDLKPENVMIDSQGNVKIMDFGIARSMDAMTRLTGSMVGTPAYMAPEQVAGKPVDFRTDIYALGLILYEMFTGQPAFHAENAVAVALKQMREAAKPPRNIDASIPPGIERAIMKCLEKDPARRFQSVAQLADALRAPSASALAAGPMTGPVVSAGSGTGGGATSRSTNGKPLAPHPLYGASAMSATEPRRGSISGWILLILLLAGGAYAALRWDQVVQFEREYAPVTASAAKYYYAQAKSFIHSQFPQAASPADAGPAAANDTQSATKGAVATAPKVSDAHTSDAVPEALNAEASKPTAVPVSSARPTRPGSRTPVAHPRSAFGAKLTSAPPPPRPSEHRVASAPSPAPASPKPAAAGAVVPATVAANITKQASLAQASSGPAVAKPQESANSGEPETLSVPPVNNHSPSYLWIGRFGSEDRAEVTASKVEGLGLPVIVIPRRRDSGAFFLVLSGPFGPERVGSVMEWLKEQGFRGIRVLKNPMRNGRLVEGVEQDPE
jgi:hypothetical protein